MSRGVSSGDDPGEEFPPAAAGSNEDAFIARLFAPIATDPAALGLRDDAALLTPPPGTRIVLTKDALVAGVHFFADDPPASIARKAMRVNVSDLAAKGAVPLGALLAIAVPPDVSQDWLTAFAEGLGADCRRYGCPLLGGDTVRTPGPLTLSVTALGAVPAEGFVARTRAGPDQAIVVTGTIGDAALGLALRLDPTRAAWTALSPQERDHLRDRYLHPQPRLEAAAALRASAAAAMDISDGLAGDVAKMLSSSGVGGCLRRAEVPLSPAARAAVTRDPALWEIILSGGDDYEIAACIPLDRLEAFLSALNAVGLPASVIGETQREPGLRVLDARGCAVHLPRLSFSHM